MLTYILKNTNVGVGCSLVGAQLRGVNLKKKNLTALDSVEVPFKKC